MAGTFIRGMPTPEIVRNMVPAGTAGQATAKISSLIVISLPLSTTGGTANAGYLSWINPEVSTIIVTDVAVRWSSLATTGTGTFDMGVSTDGTGSDDGIFDGATMDTTITRSLVSRRGRPGTEGGGTKGVAEYFVLGPGGTGTNNSIVAKTAETATTAVGTAYITYFVSG